MKKHCIIILLLSLLITSAACKKDRLGQMEESLIGSWEIREQTGSLLVVGPVISPPGNGNILQFTEKNYFFINGNRITYTGTYTVDVEVSDGVREYILTYVNNGFPRYFKIKDNKLILYEMPNVADGGTVIFERVKDPVLLTD